MKTIPCKLDYKYPYAIVKYSNDLMAKNNRAQLIIFNTREEYEIAINEWMKKIDGVYTVIYKFFDFDDEE